MGNKVNCYAADYRCGCEVCGKEFGGVAYNLVRDGSDSSPIAKAMTDGMLDLAAYAEARAAKRRLETNSGIPPYDDICFTAETCPYCGARQSWRPLPEPKEPSKPTGPVGSAVIGAFVFAFFGGLISLFIWLFADNVWAFVIPFAISVLLGAACGLWFNSISGEQDKKDYDKAVKAHAEYIAEYEEFRKSLSERKVKNEPVIDLSTGRFVAADTLK